jgi:uncharacterized membrane protein YccF (DUF307 family)
MSTLGNLLWFLLGGVFAGIAWYLVGVVMFISIVGIPWGRACFVIGNFNFAPFGREIISRKDLTGKGDLGNSPLGLIGNIVWFLLAGWWLALIHLFAAVASAVTIIGIPFAIQHIKLAAISLSPIGKTVVKKHVAEAARMADAIGKVNRIRENL